MNRNFRHFFFLFLFTGFSLSALAFTPKVKPGINDKNGSGNGSCNDGSEAKLPVGLPFQLTDPSPSSGDANENGGVTTGQPANIVYTFDLPDGVGPESVHETHSAFQQARSINAACVLIHMNSFSNALDAAENIGNEILDYDRPVMVYVNNRAIPAYTLINMAAENKTAQNNANHSINSKNGKRGVPTKNPSTNLNTKNQFNTSDYSSSDNSCTSSDFNKNHVLYSQTSNLNDVLAQAGMEKFQVVHYSAGFFSQVIDWCMKPFMSLLFILLIAIGMRTQVKSVFPGPATFLLMASLPLFAVPLFMGGLANAIELSILVLLCVTLIVSTRKKSSLLFFRMPTTILLLTAFTFCQSVNAGGTIEIKFFLSTFILTAAVFLAGWFAPSFFVKSPSERSSRTGVAVQAS
jgi:membrane-bound ClpP family serine protease